MISQKGAINLIRRRTYYVSLAIWSAIYITGILAAPLAPNRFNLTPAKTHFYQITFALPIIFIWLAAVYGAERFKSYTQSIKKDDDGKALDRMANGLTVLVAAVMSNGLSGIVRPWALKNDWLSVFTIAYNYLQVLLPLIAFYLMYTGSRQLHSLTKKKKKSLKSWLPVIFVTAIIGVFYLAIMLKYEYRSNTPDPTKYSSFYLPNWLIISTLILPYLISWALGIKSALNILLFRRDVKGVIYKEALNRFSLGVFLIIAFAVILQFLVALSTYLAKAKLGDILLIVYGIILLYSVGFIFLASGSRKLSKIEVVGK
jgi:hypothetical protein